MHVQRARSSVYGHCVCFQMSWKYYPYVCMKLNHLGVIARNTITQNRDLFSGNHLIHIKMYKSVSFFSFATGGNHWFCINDCVRMCDD